MSLLNWSPNVTEYSISVVLVIPDAYSNVSNLYPMKMLVKCVLSFDEMYVAYNGFCSPSRTHSKDSIVSL